LKPQLERELLKKAHHLADLSYGQHRLHNLRMERAMMPQTNFAFKCENLYIWVPYSYPHATDLHAHHQHSKREAVAWICHTTAGAFEFVSLASGAVLASRVH
jgi:hypothetical protein